MEASRYLLMNKLMAVSEPDLFRKFLPTPHNLLTAIKIAGGKNETYSGFNTTP